jgi:sec-independent protein translocase protein TatC
MAEALPSAQTADDPPGEKRMSFLEHLDELRSCLRNAAIAVFATTVVAYLFQEQLFALLARPFIEAWVDVQQKLGLPPAKMVYTGPHEGFMVLFKLSLLAGVFGASPVIFRELWRFISPGLYTHEKRWGLGFVLMSVVLFVGGALFAYLYVLPSSYKFFLGYAQHGMGVIKNVFGHAVDIKLSQPFDIEPMITLDEYFGLTSMLLLVFGLVFELPLVLAVLAMLGIVSAGMLWRFNRYAILLFAVAGAFLTPGDMVVGQLAMTAALTILYNLSIVLALVVGRRRARAEREAAAAS